MVSSKRYSQASITPAYLSHVYRESGVYLVLLTLTGTTYYLTFSWHHHHYCIDMRVGITPRDILY